MHRVQRIAAAAAGLLAAVTAVASGCAGEPAPTGCNGAEALCDRRVDEVSFAMTHNSHASEERHYNGAAMNQFFAVPTQLADGIRGLNFDLYEEEGELWVCHGFCALGRQPLVEILGEVRAFLDEHPREVVLLTFESYLSASQVAGAFDDSDLRRHVHTQAAGEPWPTLGEMIDAGRRLVVFTDREGGDPAWYHVKRQHIYGNHWAAASKEDLSCDLTSGPLEHGLFKLNHFLTDPIALPALAEQVNHNPYFLDRMRGCADAVGKTPSIVMVDYYDIGDVLAVVDVLNQER
jgi:hypothetical protein